MPAVNDSLQDHLKASYRGKISVILTVILHGSGQRDKTGVVRIMGRDLMYVCYTAIKNKIH